MERAERQYDGFGDFARIERAYDLPLRVHNGEMQLQDARESLRDLLGGLPHPEQYQHVRREVQAAIRSIGDTNNLVTIEIILAKVQEARRSTREAEIGRLNSELERLRSRKYRSQTQRRYEEQTLEILDAVEAHHMDEYFRAHRPLDPEKLEEELERTRKLLGHMKKMKKKRKQR